MQALEPKKGKKMTSLYLNILILFFFLFVSVIVSAEAGVLFGSSYKKIIINNYKRCFNCLGEKLSRVYFLTPISGTESEFLMTLGANARGLRDSICLRV